MRGARSAAIVVFLSATSSACAAPSTGGPGRSSATHVEAVGCVGLTVSDAEELASFYVDVLTFRRSGDEVVETPERDSKDASGWTKRIRLDLGTECLELDQPFGVATRPVPADSRSDDHWFQHVAIVVSDMNAAYARLEQRGAAHASVAPQTLPAWNAKAAGIRAYYFKDPDLHTLEIIQFPAGKGDPRWQAHDRLFLGIDHTAIVVGDTGASLSFYAEKLGLRVAGASENYGPEQERLNHVEGAHLRITTLRAAAGPGIELLEYLSPRTGRAFPAGAGATDRIHWRTTLFTPSLPEPVVALRDPDGHTMELHRR
jgi:catechol 2,3-dioxygenase-like lactoylglutathione lyase family enzyme